MSEEVRGEGGRDNMKRTTGTCMHSRRPLAVFFASFVPRGACQLESGGTPMQVVGGLSFLLS